MEEVVISGISGKFPESENMMEFQNNLFSGVDMVTEDDRRWPTGLFGLPKRNGKLKDLSRFDAMFFGVHAKQADVMDPILRLLLELTHEAIIDAGINPQELRGSKTGVFIGQTFSEAQEYFAQDPDVLLGYSLTGTSRAMIANRISFSFDLRGPSYCLDTACSSALYALQQAVTCIQNGDCESAIVGGVNLLYKPHTSLQFLRLSMLSPRGTCRAFDSTGDGYVRSETVSVVLLQKRPNARRIYATVVRTKANTDGFKVQGITYPSGAVQKALIEDLFSDISVRPQDVSYLEAHGTGTKVGDPAEVNTIDAVFCQNRQKALLLGSVKSNMGHAEAAAAMSSIAKVVIAMETGMIPKNLYFEKPNPDIPGIFEGRLKVVSENTAWDGDYAAINSFGFGGANAHCLLRAHKKPKPSPVQRNIPLVIGVSGRTQAAVEHFLDQVELHQTDQELVALIHAIYKTTIPGHGYRGFSLLQAGVPSMEITEVKRAERRPIWFVFSGMGTQWPGMGRGLMCIEVFSRAIHLCASVLRPYGVDLLAIINSSTHETFHNVLNSFISITAVQIGLTDVLSWLGIRPAGMLGHSAGEVACGYADGGFTAEQTILAAYWRGKSIQDANLKPGSMAAIGMSWEEVKKLLPPGLEAACHNSVDSVTISGPTDLLDPFLTELTSQGVFNRKVNSSGIAFHSQYVADAGPLLRQHLQKVIPHPKRRSSRWVSTSIPEAEWSKELGGWCSADYHVNNVLSPVLFHEALSCIPEGALLIEVAPHSLMQSILNRALPACSVVGLVKKDVGDDIGFFLKNIGKLYNEGVDMDLSRLYPPVSFPVGRGTPMISPMVQWDHSAEWQVPLFSKLTSKSGESVIVIDPNNENDSFITGHTIDGRVLFPATGYLTLVWKTFAKLQGTQMAETPVILEDIQFLRATIIPKEGSVKFIVNIFDGSGLFELCESGSTVVTGRVRTSSHWEGLCLPPLTTNSEKYTLTEEDVYKDLRLRGYEYKGIFRGITTSDISGVKGELNWFGNWISFVDTMLQFSLVGRKSRELALPTRILKVSIDPRKHLSQVQQGKGVPIHYYKNIEVIQSGGIEIRNLKVSLAPRRQQNQALPKCEKYVFVPYLRNKLSTVESGLTACLQIVAENSGGALKLKVVELAGKETEKLLAPSIAKILSAEPQITADISVVSPSVDNNDKLSELGIKSTQQTWSSGVDPKAHLVVAHNFLNYSDSNTIMSALKPGTFILTEEKFEASKSSFLPIAKFSSEQGVLYLLRKPSEWAQPITVHITHNSYKWVDAVIDGLKECETGDRRLVLVSQGEPNCGIIGMVNCLRQEPGGHNLRCFFIQDTSAPTFSLSVELYSRQMKQDLMVNVLREDGVWGSYRHLSVLSQEETRARVEHAFVNALTRGDLSTLRWIEGPLSTNYKKDGKPGKELVTVYYAPLNFRDIMLATGKLPPDALPGDLAGQECILGLEFAGRDSRGRRVMGIVESQGLATLVLSDPVFSWTVPDTWTLRQAATVPIVYATALYALMVRGGMKSGDSVLIHAGTGGVGQAAINIALHLGCRVFTTVGSQQKRQFIKDNFPKLNDRSIGNSRDTSFEQLILSETDGRGVDLVLNSLAEDKLQASVRCLAIGGRFLEIGKLDLSNNSPLGMSILLKNTTVHGVLLDALMSAGSESEEKCQVSRLMEDGITSGAVRPLPQTTFGHEELEQSFRFMASGKHIGKVLLQIREEEHKKVIPPQKELISAIPRTYMNPKKSYVLVGGLGGFGLELANWMVGRGAKKLILVSRSGVSNGFQSLCIKRWKQRGVQVVVSTANSTSLEGAKQLIAEAEGLGPLGGVYNLAAVLRDGMMENQTAGDFEAVCRAKVDSTVCLDSATRDSSSLDHFITFSSVSCGRGNPGQSNYGLANSSMERVCEARRAAGFPGTAIQWGAVGDVGLVLESMHGSNETVVGGTLPQRISSCLATLDHFHQLQEPVLASMVLADKGTVGPEATSSSLVDAVTNILGIKNSSNAGSSSLAELGMDSLMATEIRQTLERNYDILMSAQEIRGLTFGRLQELSVPGQQQPVVEAEGKNKVEQIVKRLMPAETAVRLASRSSSTSEKPLFFVHPIEGQVYMLEEVASHVDAPVWGLQCIHTAPLSSLHELAAFYLKHISQLQSDGPYLIVGYSFGAGVAFELATQLEAGGQEVQLLLIDGSTSFVRYHVNMLKKTQGMDKDFDAFRLAYVAKLFSNFDITKVQKEMLEIKNWKGRVSRCAQIMNFPEKEVENAADSFAKKINSSYVYEPKGKFEGEVTLLKASETFADLGDDYDLQKYCKRKLKIVMVPGDHRTILKGTASKKIADEINGCAKLLFQE